MKKILLLVLIMSTVVINTDADLSAIDKSVSVEFLKICIPLFDLIASDGKDKVTIDELGKFFSLKYFKKINLIVINH